LHGVMHAVRHYHVSIQYAQRTKFSYYMCAYMYSVRIQVLMHARVGCARCAVCVHIEVEVTKYIVYCTMGTAGF
jgi:hypothetical protein